MFLKTRLNRYPWLIPAGLMAAMAVVVWLAPAEQTLGQGIKVIYFHVALMWAGMIGLAAAGLMGVRIAVKDHIAVRRWMEALGWVGLGMFAAGVVISFWAAKINWGAVSLQEPKTAAGITFVAIGLIIKIIGGWINRPGIQGLFNAALIPLVLWSTTRSPQALHPQNAVGASTSPAIQLTFIGLLALALALEAWITWFWQKQTTKNDLSGYKNLTGLMLF